ncbi:hypothetical protein KRX51_06500 [Corynebacterium sp. TAE3-ERU12]|uniref:hypothetical protein n=1 Tax=Corynebacterium sp. TAE3-ERU12 TaxID=2849491 RepID=UPI001C4856D7|nr:hypothetical protein [Corynebacterium sp. TAE3-ERU12]MBV7295567.1 hypothetical protein [Corynebacterium sp. TAE3-ERU12]
MTARTPKFTDAAGQPVHTDIIEENGQLRLQLRNGDGEQILLLNFYDARQLAAACETFLNQRYGAATTLDDKTVANDRRQIFG